MSMGNNPGDGTKSPFGDGNGNVGGGGASGGRDFTQENRNSSPGGGGGGGRDFNSEHRNNSLPAPKENANPQSIPQGGKITPPINDNPPWPNASGPDGVKQKPFKL